MITGNVGDVFLYDRAWHVKYKLDFEKMQKACGFFIGTHDFAAFRATGTDTKTSVRTIFDLHLEKEGDIITLDVCADGFLYNMVRIMVGTFIAAYRNQILPGDVTKAIADKNRSAVGDTAPAEGLYLNKIFYGEPYSHISAIN